MVAFCLVMCVLCWRNKRGGVNHGCLVVAILEECVRPSLAVVVRAVVV